MNNDTQPLLVDDPIQTEEQNDQAKQAWNNLMNHPLIQAFRAAKEQAEIHQHGPFTFLLNQNHNALRGCQTCGAAWVGSMAGNEDNLCWHPVRELEED